MDKKLTKFNGISVVCASKNEEVDIHHLLESFLHTRISNSELIIVDDSDDSTRAIVEDFVDKNNAHSIIKLLHGERTGCCDARNKGISAARYDIISFMTADSFFPVGYFEFVTQAFARSNCSALMLDSKVSNLGNVYARFLQSWHDRKKLVRGKHYSPLTTQGYCVSKHAAMEVGLIDSDFASYNVCRDWTLVKKMDSCGFKKLYRPDFSVPHIAPSTFREFWWTHKQRGVISGGYKKFFDKKNWSYRFLIVFIKWLKVFVSLSILVPFFKAFHLTKSSSKVDFFSFSFLVFLKDFSFTYGETTTLFK